MQKKLIALAIAGLSSTAFAQSNVTISGQLKAGYESYRLSNAGAADGRQNMISDQTSSIVLKGSESLGNGLSAIFQIDNRFTVDTGSGAPAASNALGGGNTHVGIKGSFGEFKIGRQDLHYNEIERIENGAKSLSQQAMVGRGILSQINGTPIGVNASRTNNVVFWDSPNWGGITARLAYSTAPVTEGATNAGAGLGDGGFAWNGAIRYENGPIKTGYSYLNTKVEGGAVAAGTAASSQESNRAWFAYNFAGFSVGVAYDRSEQELVAGRQRRNGWAIPVSYNFGNHGVYATYARVGRITGGAAPAANDTRAKQWTLGYDYNLSKRTSVGINYTKLDNNTDASYDFSNLKGTATPTTTATYTGGADAKQFYAGIRHAY